MESAENGTRARRLAIPDGVTATRLMSTAAGVVALIFGVGIAAYGYLGTFTRYMADDYCTAAVLKTKGFWGSQRHWYDVWSGRFSFTFVVNAVELMGLGIVSVLPALTLAVWLVALTWAVRQGSALAFGTPADLAVSIALASVVLFHLVHTLPNLGQTLYWQTGSVTYVIPLILTCILIGMGARWVRGQNPPSRGETAAIGVISFLAAGFNETHTVIQLAAFGMLLASLFLMSSTVRTRFFVPLSVGMLSTIAGFLVVYVAPGNDVRRSYFPEPGPWQYVLRTSLDGTNGFLLRYEIYERATLALVAAVAIVTWAMFALAGKPLPSLTMRQTLATIIVSANAAYGVVVLCFLPSVYLYSAAPSDRSLATASFVLTGLLALWSFLLGYWLARMWTLVRLPLGRYAATAVAAIALALAMWTGPLHIAAEELSDRDEYAAYAEQWDRRQEYLRSQAEAGNRNVQVDALGRTFLTEDVTGDPAYWINGCMAMYYDLDTVTTGDNQP